MDDAVAHGMARRLGAWAWTAVAFSDDDAALRPFDDDLDICGAEVRFHLRHGAVRRLQDLVLRRLRVGMWQPSRAEALSESLADRLGRARGWSAARWQAELEDLHLALEGWRATAFEGLLTEAARPLGGAREATS